MIVKLQCIKNTDNICGFAGLFEIETNTLHSDIFHHIFTKINVHLKGIRNSIFKLVFYLLKTNGFLILINSTPGFDRVAGPNRV